MESMSSVVFEGAGRVVVAARPVPTVRDPRDVLIRVRATGICGTDRAIVLGEFPAKPGVVLGHESVGEVVTTGASVHGLRPGDRVVVNPTYYCRRCRPCRRDRAAHCEAKDGREMGVDCDGTMASYAVVPARFLHPISPAVPDRRAALVEPLACVLANIEAAGGRWDDRVLVAGAGPIGMLCALTLAQRGVRVVLAERDPARVEIATAVLPRTVQVTATDGGLAGATPHRPDVVIDTTGVLLADAVDLVEPGGTVVVMGEREGARATVRPRAIATQGVRVVGAGPYPPHLFEAAVDLAVDLPMECLVTHELPVTRVADALALLGVDLERVRGRDYEAGKVLLVPEPDGDR